MDKIICIAGPTASGKTALAVSLAERLNGEIISCDSMQIYRRMDIGTAKPSAEEQHGIPHFMLDIIEPQEDFSVSRYCEMADPILQDILRRGKTAIIAGGTGLYMDSLIKGLSFAASPSTGVRKSLEARANAEGINTLLAELQMIDPDCASRLHLNDRKRILRALEIYQETGETMTEHDKRTSAIPPKYHPVWIGLDFDPRSLLYSRINQRVDHMLASGLLNEIRELLDSGVPEKCTAMQAIGYKEFLDAERGLCTIEDAAARVQQSSRHYAKRQLTWFRRNQEMHWLVRNEVRSAEDILSEACNIIRNMSQEEFISHG